MKKRLQTALTVASLGGLLGACAPTPEQAAPINSAIPDGSLDPYVAHKDTRSGLPTFVWLTPRPTDPVGKDATEVAWRVLRELSATYRMSAAAMQTVQLKTMHDQGHGAILAQFAQQVDGLEVFLHGVTVAMDQSLRPVAASGNFAPAVRRTAADFAHPPSDAIAAALQQVIGGSLPTETIITKGPAQSPKDRYTQFAVAPVVLANQTYTLAAPARTKQVLFAGPQGLIPSYYVELGVRADSGSPVRWQSLVISAADNEVLFTKDLTAYDAFSYRVWADSSGKFTPHTNPYGEGFMPHPTGKPDGSRPTVPLLPNLVSLQNVPFSKNDPWLPAGATETKGNNVWAYADIAAPNGFDTGDVTLPPSAAGVFDYTVDPDADTTVSDAVRLPGITQLFYTVNYMHDSFYDAGYDEKSGNPQTSNYGRGGVEGDAILAEAQDYSGVDNANCATPADGSAPRIQMYQWTNPRILTVLMPPQLVKVYEAGSASFGPPKFNLTGNLVLVDDGVKTATDGCETPYVNAAAVAGNIAVIDRGSCSFAPKVKNAQLAGAVGVIIVNNVAGTAPGLGNTVPPTTGITIPSMSVTQSDGALFKTALAAGTAVQVSIVGTIRDGSFDNSVIAHEWGHSLSHRLIYNSAGLGTGQSNGLGEGWSDFVALLTLVRAEAAAVPSNANWNGAFSEGAFDQHLFPNSYYYGLRRYPYSSDLAKNPLTYKYISEGVPLPTMPAPNFGASGTGNSEVHSTGEVWASMLWDCYTNMLRDTNRYTFDNAQKTMREYLVASLKLTPSNPTLLEARDAVLATMYARDKTDFAACAASFARRKAGNGAVSPDRYDSKNLGAVESSALGPEITLVSYKLDDSARSCDNDGVIDNTETGRLTVVIRNTGTAPLTDATLTATGDSPYFYFLNAGRATFPIIQPYQSGTAQVDFQLKDAPGVFTGKVTFNLTAASLAVPATISTDVSRLMNYDVSEGVATTDTFGVVSKLGWTAAGDTTLMGATPWTQTTDEMGGGSFSIPDNGVRSDQYLISPPIVADATASLGFSFKHRFVFESDDTYNYDGAIVELSDDNGQTWTDIGSKFTMGGYNGSLSYVADESVAERNPLTPTADRPAFVGQSDGLPAFMTTTADLGTTYAGKTIRLRFRVGTDPAGNEAGWEISQVSVTGATNKPFAQAIAQPPMCANRPPVVTVTPTEQTVPSGNNANLQGTVADPDNDSLVYEWVQLSGPTVPILNPTALNQAFTVPPVTEATEATFVLRASDGKSQSEAVAKITFAPPTSGSAKDALAGGGCSCRTVPEKTRTTDALWDVMWVLLAGLYCHRRRVLKYLR